MYPQRSEGLLDARRLGGFSRCDSRTKLSSFLKYVNDCLVNPPSTRRTSTTSFLRGSIYSG